MQNHRLFSFFQPISLALICLTTSALLYTDAAVAAGIVDGYYVNVIGGQLKSTHNTDEHPLLFTVGDDPVDTLFQTTSAATATDLGLEAGIITQLNAKLGLLWGLGAYRSTNQTVEGNYYFNFDTDPDSHYSYKLSSLRTLFSVASRYAPWSRLPNLAFIGQLGLGYGWLTASNYDTQTVGQYASPGFDNKTRGQVAYQYGLGLEYRLFHSWSVGVHYDWLPFGSVSMPANSSNAQATPSVDGASLSTGAVNETRLSLQLRYEVPAL